MAVLASVRGAHAMAAVGGYWYGWRVLERPVLQRCFEHDVGVGIGMLADALSSDDRCMNCAEPVNFHDLREIPGCGDLELSQTRATARDVTGVMRRPVRDGDTVC